MCTSWNAWHASKNDQDEAIGSDNFSVVPQLDSEVETYRCVSFKSLKDISATQYQ